MGTTKSLILLGFLALMACSSSHSEGEHELHIESRKSVSSDIKIPSELWDLIEEKMIVDHGKVVPPPVGGEGGVLETENLFSSVNVKLTNKSPDVLREVNIEGKNGLIIDLADYLKADSGTFKLKIEPEFELIPPKSKVYFVSRARKRKVDGQILGAGCNKYFDITDHFLKSIKDNGLEVNVYRNRHASLLGGYFIFTSGGEAGIRSITQVSFTDSRYPQYRCGSDL